MDVAALEKEMIAKRAPGSPESKVLRLQNMVTAEELTNDEEYEEIEEDIREECEKYGAVLTFVLPRPPKAGEPPVVGVGKVKHTRFFFFCYM